jgi:hypothetical protein
MRNAGRSLLAKPQGRPLGRARRRRVGNIKMDLREIGWTDLGQGRGQWRALVNTIMNLWVP